MRGIITYPTLIISILLSGRDTCKLLTKESRTAKVNSGADKEQGVYTERQYPSTTPSAYPNHGYQSRYVYVDYWIPNFSMDKSYLIEEQILSD